MVTYKSGTLNQTLAFVGARSYKQPYHLSFVLREFPHNCLVHTCVNSNIVLPIVRAGNLSHDTIELRTKKLCSCFHLMGR